MTTGDLYRAKAAQLLAQAKRELVPAIRIDLETLAQSYLRLAEQADRNSANDIRLPAPSGQGPPHRLKTAGFSGQTVRPAAR